jgi:acyl dehydratase
LEEKISLKIGKKFYFEREFTQEDFNRFAMLSKDDNPIHIDPQFSAKTKFGQTVAHGMFLYGNVCRAISDVFPNTGFIQLSQDLMFPSPTFTKEKIIVELNITNISSDNILDIETIIKKPNGEIGLQGSTKIQRLRSNTKNKWKIIKNSRNLSLDDTQLSFKGIKLNQCDKITRTIKSDEFFEYLNLLRDSNKMFTDIDYIKSVGFENFIIPGPLIGGIFSHQLGTRLPGKGTNWLKLNINFLKPIYINQEIKSVIEVIRIRSEKQLINLKARCYSPNNDLVVDGDVLVLISDLVPH